MGLDARREACRALSVVLLGLALLGACHASPPASERLGAEASARARNRERVRELRVVEASLRADHDPRSSPPWIDVSGADPYRLVPRGEGGFVGVLRGSKALVTLADDLRELSRVKLAEAPTALCVSGRRAFVASRWSRALWRVDLDAMSAFTSIELGLDGVADLACGEEGVVHVLGAGTPELVTLDRDGRWLDRRPALPGGLRLLRHGRHLLELSLFERALRVLEVGRSGVPARERARVVHNGPFWAVAALERDGELLLALSGAEDRPLVRANGEFENIDSFVWLYRLEAAGLALVASLNVGERGLIVPKALSLSRSGETLELSALAAGSGRLLRARFSGGLEQEPHVSVEPCLPGASEAVFDEAGNVSFASPLFDAWVRVGRRGASVTYVDPERRPPPEIRLGEALFTTELIAPANSSSGGHSRFSCETCHFEGGVDGRTHHTGRGDVSVVTKPLFGLSTNRPHFSRARDPDLSAVSHNEFRVAGAGSGENPWFTLEAGSFPWLFELGVQRGQLSPLELRTALLRFLYAFSHAPNVNTVGRSRFSELEAAGARVFSMHCASCHAARLRSDEASSELPANEWEPLLFSRASPLVWARADYAKTGVVPYVDERGTRITSLRRLALKPRYFTSGTAPDLSTVLERFRAAPGGALHEAPKATPGALELRDRQALLAFLRLL